MCELEHRQDGITGVGKAHEIHGKRHPQDRREQGADVLLSMFFSLFTFV